MKLFFAFGTIATALAAVETGEATVRHATVSNEVTVEARGGTVSTFGGGGYGGYMQYCPNGHNWGNAGKYCLGSDIYHCDFPGQTVHSPSQYCNSGCMRNPPGTPDRCHGHGGGYPGNYYCRHSSDCNYNEICRNGYCSYHSGGGGHHPGDAYCTSSHQCRHGQICRNGYCSHHSGGGGGGHYPGNGSCSSSHQCYLGEVCLLGTCQAVIGGGSCNSCDNSGCSYGHRCVHEGSDYSCNGVCRSHGSGGGYYPSSCSSISDCPFGRLCLLGSCILI